MVWNREFIHRTNKNSLKYTNNSVSGVKNWFISLFTLNRGEVGRTKRRVRGVGGSCFYKHIFKYISLVCLFVSWDSLSLKKRPRFSCLQFLVMSSFKCLLTNNHIYSYSFWHWVHCELKNLKFSEYKILYSWNPSFKTGFHNDNLS